MSNENVGVTGNVERSGTRYVPRISTWFRRTPPDPLWVPGRNYDTDLYFTCDACKRILFAFEVKHESVPEEQRVWRQTALMAAWLNCAAALVVEHDDGAVTLTVTYYGKAPVQPSGCLSESDFCVQMRQHADAHATVCRGFPGETRDSLAVPAFPW